jgi:predicted O-linked N-acetylglucosamine transferase (SPINDLY family)
MASPRAKPAAGALDQAVAALHRGDARAAVVAAGRAIREAPGDARAWEAMAVACYQAGEIEGAIDAGRRATKLDPGASAAWANLGVALKVADRTPEAEAAYRKAIEADPAFATAHNNFGNLLRDTGRLTEAEASFRAAVSCRSDYADAWRSLGSLLLSMGRIRDAVEALGDAAAKLPDNPDILSDRGALLTGLNQLDEAHACLTHAIELAPQSAVAHGNLGAVYLWAGRLLDAERATRRAHELAPDEHRWVGNLAVIHKDLGRFEAAEAFYRQALAIKPDYAAGHGNLLFCLNYHPEKTAEEIFAEYRRFDERHAKPLMPQPVVHQNDPDPDRRLRIGYVSPDFREHSARHYIEPLLAAHDRSEVEIYCYAELAAPDQATARFQAMADAWRPTAGLDDVALAELIRRDRIDVLVDLGGHTASSRLPVFARKPAPVQVAHFLGHGYTSGFSAMDAFLGDAALAPEGCDHLFAEPIVRLPRIPLAYVPAADMPGPTPSPAMRNGFTTFGYFGRAERINDKVVAAWSQILRRSPGARLRLNSRPFADPPFCALMRERFAEHGVGEDQLDLVFTSPQPKTWAAYGEIDVALDPFPHNAGATTIEALWLGVPVLSLKDRPSVGRFGASILGALGLDAWASDDVDSYVAKGVAAALNPEGPAMLRRTLRRRFQESPLADAKGLAREMEGAYRSLWRAWCGKAAAQPQPAPRPASSETIARLHQLFTAGDLQGTEDLARSALNEDANAAEARQMLGLVAYQRGDFAAAEAALEQSIAAAETPEAWSNLGAARRAAGKIEAAEAALRRAIALAPTFADARRNLVNLMISANRFDEAAEMLRETGVLIPTSEGPSRLGDLMNYLNRPAEAADAYAEALRRDPSATMVGRKLALMSDRAGRADKAAVALEAVLAAEPGDAPGWAGLSDVYRRLGRMADAEAAARRAVELDPTLPAAANCLGNVLAGRGRPLEAEAAFEQAIAIDPTFAEAYNNRALSLAKRGLPTAAERDLRAALQLRPDLTEIGFNLASALQDQGRLAEALAVYRDALVHNPDHPVGHGVALFCLSYLSDMAPETVYAEFRAWEARHALKFLPAEPPRPVDAAEGRRLRVGYVSPDFCAKSAAYFIEPLLAGHDRSAVEVFCYAEVARPDAVTERMKALAEHWRPTVGLSDDALAEFIRSDRIDVLVDLAGHTANNRLLALARKPAPVQIAHFLGHGYTSGLQAMDVFLADAALAPEGSDGLFAERIERLARIPIAYQPVEGMPEPAPSPAKRKGHVTFGHFGRTVRLNDKVVAVWAEILKRVPGSRLMLNAAPFSDPGVCERYAGLFEAHGVARDRLDLVFTTPQAKTFEAYGEVDIALDPFPHNAGTTTIEALWLGVPVLTLADRPSVGRFGASILGAIGLEEWVAGSVEAYVEKAVEAACDIEGLARLRGDLRARIEASPLRDGEGLARLLEATYRRLVAEKAGVSAPAAHAAASAAEPSPEADHLKNLFLSGDVAGAEALGQAMLARNADDPDALHVLGLVAYQRGEFRPASELIYRSLTLRPDAHAWSNLGSCLRSVGDLPNAEIAFKNAMALDPELHDARVNFAHMLLDRSRAGEAEAALRPVIESGRASANAWLSLGNSLYMQGRLVQAVEAFEQSLAIEPQAHDTNRNLGSTLAGLGRLEEAERYHRRALEIRPDYVGGHSSLLFNLNYSADMSAEQIFEEYRRYDDQHGAQLKAEWRPHANDRDPERRLRVGYVSPDFRQHAVSLFAEPLLAAHDPEKVEIYLYAEVASPDAVSERFKALASAWISTVGMSDDALAERIREDRIDVLVDLAGHSSNNRLYAFMRKPAPVQVNYLLGHGYTSGLSAMDAFLTDKALTPPGSQSLFCERLVQLGRPPLVYEPPAGMADVGPLPARRNGYITFGHFGRSVRINARVVKAWAEILKRVEGSRLVLNNAPFADPDVSALIADRFAAEGIPRERLDLIFTAPQTVTWAAYNDIDIALDPFPHNAGTTTIEALWMGVPVVSLADRPSVGRFGAMILGAVGLRDWVAVDERAYVGKAVAAVNDLDKLEALRAGLRDRFAKSPLRDAPGLARAIEDAYRTLWRDWCAKPEAAPKPERKRKAAPGSGANVVQLKKPPATALEAFTLEQAVDAFNFGDLAAASRAVAPALEADPDNTRALHLRGLIAYREGRLEDAARDVARVVELSPELAEPRWNLTAVLRSLGRLDEACQQGREAVRLAPGSAAAHNNLGAVLRDLGWALEAETSFNRALTIDPNNADAWSNLGWLLSISGRAREGEEAARKAIAITPNDGNAWNTLGSAFLYQDRLGEAAQAFRRAVELKPSLDLAHSNLLFCLNYRLDLSAQAIFEEYKAWNARHAAPLAPAQRPAKRAIKRGEKLRIGYVSPDFRHHAASFFVEPMLAAHDRSAVEIFCYAEVPKPDAVTERFRRIAHQWRSTVGLTDEAVAEMIRSDGIDVLVDLAGHTGGNRLLAFARRPAAVQVAHMVGSGQTTGLSAIDAYLCDGRLCPDGADKVFSERLVRMSRLPLVYRPPEGMPEVSPAPCRRNGFVTFGCFSRTARINDRVLDAWAAILKGVPDARLMLNAKPFQEAAAREAFEARFAGRGVEPERLDLVYTTPQRKTWAAYGEIDIALDPFPHNAGTTTIEALWMGVPVVSLSDRPPVGRFGAAILGAVGLDDWIAEDVGGYVAKAVAAASHPKALAKTRAGLRARFEKSPLKDATGLARELEGAYRKLIKDAL